MRDGGCDDSDLDATAATGVSCSVSDTESSPEIEGSSSIETACTSGASSVT